MSRVDSRNDFNSVAPEEINALSKIISLGQFTDVAAKGEINLKALIALSDRVERVNEGAKPTFNFICGKDALTLRVANRLYAPLKAMGFKPAFLFGTYDFSPSFEHPQIEELAWQTQLLNQVVIPKMDEAVGYPQHQLLTPGNLKHIPGLKVLDNVDSVNDPQIINHIGSQDKNVGISLIFRLYEKIGPEFINLYHNQAGQWGTHERPTNFRVHSDDNGVRKSILSNIHPSTQDHGVIPVFWPQLRMLELMNRLEVDHTQHSATEIAQICLENGLNPYATGMIHHVVEEFDQGDVILPGQNHVPIDLSKPMWENYHALEDFIVDSILATAAAYKLDVDLKGTPQNLNDPNVQYHSWPGIDSKPPMTLRNRDEIKARDAYAMNRFAELGGELTNRDFFMRFLFGDPQTGMKGFVHPETFDGANIHMRLREANADRTQLHPQHNVPDVA